jgi:hypothetical protein
VDVPVLPHDKILNLISFLFKPVNARVHESIKTALSSLVQTMLATDKHVTVVWFKVDHGQRMLPRILVNLPRQSS